MLEKSLPHESHSSFSGLSPCSVLPFFFWTFCLFSLYWMTSSKPKFSSKALVAFPRASEAMRGGSMEPSEPPPGANSFFSLAFKASGSDSFGPVVPSGPSGPSRSRWPSFSFSLTTSLFFFSGCVLGWRRAE